MNLKFLQYTAKEEIPSLRRETMIHSGCTVCGRRNHAPEEYWSLLGFPKTHPQYKKQQKNKE